MPAALAVLLTACYATGLAYLAARGGVPIALPMARVDVLHVLAGLGAAVFATCLGIRWRHRRAAWSRWMKGLLLGASVLYAGTVLTGLLILLPLADDLRDQLTQGHLISSVWAAEPSLLLLWELRQRGRSAGPRTVGGAAAVRRHRLRGTLLGAATLLPALALATLAPRALSPVAQRGGDESWQPAGPQTFIDQMVPAPDGRTLIAGGLGLFAGEADGAWRALAPFDAADPVLGLHVSSDGTVYVGTGRGLYRASSIDAPFLRLSLPAPEIHGIATPPGGRIVWATSLRGIWRSRDGGATWQLENAGLERPITAWAIHDDAGTVVASDVTGVYRWTGDRWARESHQPFVYSFDRSPDGHLFASAMGGGIRVRVQGRWEESDAGLLSHSEGALQGIHEISLSFGEGRAYGGSMLAGGDVSLDGGHSWGQQWPGLSRDGDVWRILPVGADLVAATDRGLLRYRLPTAPPAGPLWWVVAITVGGAATLVAVRWLRGRREPPPVPPPTGGR